MENLRKAFYDIAAGYSRGVIFSREAFIKHLSYEDQINYDELRESFYKQAKDSGIETNEEKLKILRQQGIWTEEMDKEINASKLMIDSLYEGKKSNMKMPSLVKKYVENIREEEKKYNEKIQKKNQLMGLTCESYAEREVNDYYIFTNIFKNKELTERFFDIEEFDYFDDQKFSDICASYNKILEACSMESIKKIAMQPFFQEYFSLAGDNLKDFFDKPIYKLSFYQVKLLNYGSHFRNIYQNHDISRFPKEVQSDPDLLIDYAIAASKGKEEMQKQGAYDGEAITVGMSKEDSKVLGVKTNNNLAAEIAKSGGNVIDWAMRRGG